VLVPIIYNGPGRRGSQWVTELAVRNSGAGVIEPWRGRGNLAALAPGRPVVADIGEAPGGLFLVVPRESVENLHANLRVRDTSREATEWGAEVPIVRERDFATDQEILNVPFDGRYRVTLRLYAPAPTARVWMNVYALTSPGPTTSRTLVELDCAGVPCASDQPAFAAIELNSPLAVGGTFGIRLETFSGGRVWGFATLTNNATQQVTVIAAQ
jgi:hypothetical protein